MIKTSLLLAAGFVFALSGAAQEAQPAADDTGGFNLRLPGEDTTTQSYGGFNLSLPADTGQTVQPAQAGGEPLGEFPEVGAPAAEAEDEIVRLEPK